MQVLSTPGQSSPENSAIETVLHIRCKYYHADVVLREVLQSSELTKAEGVVVCFDGQKAESWDLACEWMKTAKKSNLPLRLLVCDRIVPASLSKAGDDVNFVYRFVVEQEFELIELTPEENSIEEGEEFGVHRLKSALEAHMWPNMEFLDPKKPSERSKNDLKLPIRNGFANNSFAVSGYSNDQTINDRPNNSPERLPEEQKLDDTVESFERLCLKILKTRDQISGLGFEERRKLAEKVTLDFLNAIGDSDGDLTDESDSLPSTDPVRPS